MALPFSIGEMLGGIGTVLGSVGTIMGTMKRGDIKSLKAAQEQCEKANQGLREDLEKNDKETRVLEGQVKTLNDQLQLVEKEHGRFPLPFAIVDAEGCVAFVSFEAYRRIFAPMKLRERDVKGQPFTSLWPTREVARIIEGLIERSTESESKFAYAYNVRLHTSLPALNILAECRESSSGGAITHWFTAMPADPRLAQMASGVVATTPFADTGERRREADNRSN